MQGKIVKPKQKNTPIFIKEEFIFSIISNIDKELKKYKVKHNKFLSEQYEKFIDLNYFVEENVRNDRYLNKLKKLSQQRLWENEIKNAWYIYNLDFIIYEYEMYTYEDKPIKSKHPNLLKFKHKTFTKYIIDHLINIYTSEKSNSPYIKEKGIKLYSIYKNKFQKNKIKIEKRSKIDAINYNEILIIDKIFLENQVGNLKNQIGFYNKFFQEYENLYEEKEFKETWKDSYKKLQTNHPEFLNHPFDKFNANYKAQKSIKNKKRKELNRKG